MSGEEYKYVSLEVLKVLNTQITVVWDVTPCNLVDSAFEMSLTTHRNDTAPRHIPQPQILHSMNLYYTENFKCYNNRKIKV